MQKILLMAALMAALFLSGAATAVAEDKDDADHEAISFALGAANWAIKADLLAVDKDGKVSGKVNKNVEGRVVITKMTKYAVLDGFVQYGKGPKQPFTGRLDLKDEVITLTFTRNGIKTGATGEVEFARDRKGKLIGAKGKWKPSPKSKELDWRWIRE